MRTLITLPENQLFKSRVGYWHGTIFIHHNKLGPSKVYQNGDELWYIHNQLHNAAGPAMISPRLNLTRWYLEDERLPVKSQEEFLLYKKNNKIK